MSERIRLSLWFETHAPEQILTRLAASVEALPAESRERGVREVAASALDWSEPTLLEECFDPGIELAEALDALRPFVQEDCACTLGLEWTLWVFENSKWKQKPHGVRLICLGSSFGMSDATDMVAEQGHLLVEFGLDEPFLAEQVPWNVETRRHLQANILQLLAYTRKLEAELQPRARRLWSEDETDWTQKLIRRLQLATGEDTQLVQ